jgi:hypothetical protein
MIVTEQYNTDTRELLKLYGRVGDSFCRNPRAEMDMISRMEEVWVCENADALPFKNCSCCAEEGESCIFGTVFTGGRGGVSLVGSCFWER